MKNNFELICIRNVVLNYVAKSNFVLPFSNNVTSETFVCAEIFLTNSIIKVRLHESLELSRAELKLVCFYINLVQFCSTHFN